MLRESQISDDPVILGDAAYNYLALELYAASGQLSQDSLGRAPLSEDSYDTIGLLSPASSYTGHGVSPSIMCVPVFVRPRKPSDISLSETIFPSLSSPLHRRLPRPHPAPSITNFPPRLTKNQAVAAPSLCVSAAPRDIAAVYAM